MLYLVWLRIIGVLVNSLDGDLGSQNAGALVAFGVESLGVLSTCIGVLDTSSETDLR